jgi:hypothetical protein
LDALCVAPSFLKGGFTVSNLLGILL